MRTDYQVSRLLVAAKIVVLAGLLVFAPWGWAGPIADRLSHFTTMDRNWEAAVFLAIVSLCFAGLLIVAFLRNGWLRVPLVLLVIAGIGVDQISLGFTGRPLDPMVAELLWRERAMAWETVVAYFDPGLLPLVGALGLAALVLALKSPPHAALGVAWASVPVAAFSASFAVAYLTASGTRGFPAPFGVPAKLASSALLDRYSGPREAPQQVTAPRSRLRKVVLIVDESVRGDYLAINDPAQRNTPFLASQERLINFGPAVAAHNCSAPARLILRTGLRPAELPDVRQRALKKPAIWQYANLAGFETFYVDAFAEVFAAHSYMNGRERGLIEHRLAIRRQPVFERDREIAEKILPQLLMSDRRMFIYVDKFGSHFPYRRTYPPDFPHGDGPPPHDNLDMQDELIESYRRALRWSVDEFFSTLVKHADFSDTVVIYTSDHGQSLLQGGYRLTHCSTGAVHPGEGIVPLFAFTGDSWLEKRLRDAAREGYGRMSHFNIFPTLLLALGYDESWVLHHYGRSLVHLPDNGKRQFLTGDMFGTGFGAKWIIVD